MSRDPAERYATAREMAAGPAALARGPPGAGPAARLPGALGARVCARTWSRSPSGSGCKLIYPHEAERLRAAYRPLEAREDDWIVGSRVLSCSQIALYLGAFLLACGSVLYFDDVPQGRRARAAAAGADAAAAVRRAERWRRTALPPRAPGGGGRLLPRRRRAAAARCCSSLFREAGLLMAARRRPRRALRRRSATASSRWPSASAAPGLALLAARTRTVALSSGAARPAARVSPGAARRLRPAPLARRRRAATCSPSASLPLVGSCAAGSGRAAESGAAGVVRPAALLRRRRARRRRARAGGARRPRASRTWASRSPLPPRGGQRPAPARHGRVMTANGVLVYLPACCWSATARRCCGRRRACSTRSRPSRRSSRWPT